MKQEKTYHIDVTPEEDALFNPDVQQQNNPKINKPPISFSKVFCIVLGVHAVIGMAILASTSSAQAKQKEPVNFTQPIAEIPQTVDNQPLIDIAKNSPTPTPTPESKPVSSEITAKQETSAAKPKAAAKYTKEYVVKQGDTLYSIAKKYKLNTERLIKINNIKDSNKLVVGQKLKFM